MACKYLLSRRSFLSTQFKAIERIHVQTFARTPLPHLSSNIQNALSMKIRLAIVSDVPEYKVSTLATITLNSPFRPLLSARSSAVSQLREIPNPESKPSDPANQQIRRK